METKELIRYLYENPESWPARMAVIEDLVRHGEVDRAKALVRESPDHVPMPPDYPLRIHTLFTRGIETSSPASEPAVDKTGPVDEEKMEVYPSISQFADETVEKHAPALERPVPLFDGIKPPAAMNVAQLDSKPPALVVVDTKAVESSNILVKRGERMSALVAAIMIHLVVVFLLVQTRLKMFPQPPPLISISHVASSDDSSLENNSLSRNTTSSPSLNLAAQQVMSATSFSSFAIPDALDSISDFPMMSLDEIGSGFGMASSGSGDVAFRGAVPPSMRSRCSIAERMKRLLQSGGNRNAETAVVLGLDFLTSKQNKETGAIGRSYPVAMTGLSLLAYLGHCETPESIQYGDAVIKSTLYLIDRAIKNNGLIASSAKGNHVAYEHAIATYALAEFYTMSRAAGKEVPRITPVLKRAVYGIVKSQKERGGWSYLGAEEEDMSVSGWNIQALKAARNTNLGIVGVDTALDKAVGRYLPAIQDGRGAFKYRPNNGNGKPTLTGAALLGLQIWGKMGSAHYNKGFDYLTKAYAKPFPDNNYYAPYYNTQVFFLHGGEPWERYNDRFLGPLLDAQNNDGSWPAMGSHGGADKQILNTAWAILMLEVYYRYLPTTDKVGDLMRGKNK